MTKSNPAYRLHGTRKATRRDWLGALASVTAASALMPSQTWAAPSGYGIVGRRAPNLHAQYWIDAQGKPTEFSMAETHGRWVLVKCFQGW